MPTPICIGRHIFKLIQQLHPMFSMHFSDQFDESVPCASIVPMHDVVHVATGTFDKLPNHSFTGGLEAKRPLTKDKSN